MDNPYLTSIETLKLHLDREDLKIIDTRKPAEYQEGHIPGAINIYDIFTYLCTKETGGYEAMNSHFASLFRTAGLSGREHVVIYEDAMDNGYGRSCRGWFILRYLGHHNVSVLHGGYQAWLAGDHPVTIDIPKVEEKDFPVNLDPSIILTTEEMLAALGDPNIIILDCRDHVEWVGTSSSPYGPDYAPRKGRIPGAVWLEWYQTMHRRNQIYWFKSPQELQSMFAEEGITKNSNIYLYCFKGARTSNLFVAMKMAGIDNVRNYIPSWNEWSRNPDLPIETGYPTRKRPA